MRKPILLTLFAMTGAAAGTWSGEAEASDDKAYHAYSCQANDGIETDYGRSEYRLTRTGSESNGIVVCPVIKDVHACSGWNACSFASVEVKVYDGHLTENIACAFTARNETGSQVSYDSDTSQLGHDTLAMDINWPQGHGAYALRCTMPTNNNQGYTKIYGYFVEESTG